MLTWICTLFRCDCRCDKLRDWRPQECLCKTTSPRHHLHVLSSDMLPTWHKYSEELHVEVMWEEKLIFNYISLRFVCLAATKPEYKESSVISWCVRFNQMWFTQGHYQLSFEILVVRSDSRLNWLVVAPGLIVFVGVWTSEYPGLPGTFRQMYTILRVCLVQVLRAGEWWHMYWY